MVQLSLNRSAPRPHAVVYVHRRDPGETDVVRDGDGDVRVTRRRCRARWVFVLWLSSSGGWNKARCETTGARKLQLKIQWRDGDVGAPRAVYIWYYAEIKFSMLELKRINAAYS